jgi:hypothetical protein
MKLSSLLLCRPVRLQNTIVPFNSFGHVVLAVETFFKAYNATVTHLGDVVQQKKSQVLIHLDLLFSTLTLKMLHKLQANELK